MEKVEYKIIDNVIYTPDPVSKPDPKGVGHYYYSKMVKNKNKIAQIDGYTKEQDTFESLLQRSIRTALAMTDNGIKPGDHLSICTYNHFNSVVPHIASYFTGSIMAAINPSMTVDAAVHLLQQTLPKIIFAAPSTVELVEQVVKRIKTETIIVVFGETSRHIPFSKFILPHQNENKFKPKEVDNLNTLALIVFSSGTTGMPKAICYSHLNMLASIENVNLENIQGYCSTTNPYGGVFSVFLHLSIKYGRARVVYPTYSTDDPWCLFYQRVDFAYLNSLQALNMVRSKKPDNINLKNVKVLLLAGNALMLKQLNEIRSMLPYTFVCYKYSQSELFIGCFVPITTESKLYKNNEVSVGTIVQGFSYKVVDIETNKVLGPNQVGELLVKSMTQFIGYFNNDSSERFDSDSWLKTGDLFYYNEDLCFYIVDRIRESFKYYNFHISPAEVENVILDLEPIDSTVVIGVPHESDGSHPMALVKLKTNAKKISKDEIINYVENKLENYKWLRGGVKFVDSFPMTVSGKIDRFKLKSLIVDAKPTSSFSEIKPGQYSN